ncbi:hypothetical protein HDU91_004471 [Kappamyces sp. JEL0680]|nr:hypothetical protein HDU91_004471 [Kappamyces sp. JEL0680]
MPENLCISSFAMPSARNDSSICFTLATASQGWVALGVGSKYMRGADIYAVWLNSTSHPNVHRLVGNGHQLPLPNDIQNMIPLPVSDEQLDHIPEWAAMVASFCRPALIETSYPSGKSVLAGSSYIFAYSTQPPTARIDTLGAQLGFHQAWDTFDFDFTAFDELPAAPTPAPGLSFEQAATIHGLVMWMAWVVSPLVGMFVARYLKTRLGHVWYLSHLALMGLVTGGLTTVGFFLMVAYMHPPHFSRSNPLEDTHIKLGLAIFILMFVQIALGFLSNHFFDARRTSAPLLDRVHWWTGRVLVLAGLANTTLGMVLFRGKGFALPLVFEVVHWTVLGLGILAFAVAELRLGQVHHKLAPSTPDQDPLLEE